MVSMSTRFAGLTKAQAELVKHWRDCSRHNDMPSRECLDPGAIKMHLSEISMVEMSDRGEARFRLAGSGLRQLFGREMRGRLLSDLNQTTFEMWTLGLSRALDMGQPIGGLIDQGGTSHAWLRLPLRSEGLDAVVLCHDALIPNARLNAHSHSQSHKSVNIDRSIAA
ncbi:MAG: PAS domain-containing protein [Pseudomonadota bacterium]